MGNLITLTSFSPVSNPPTAGATASAVLVNVSRIISVKTRTTAYNTTGVTNVVYALPVNNTFAQIELIVTEAQAAILTAANSNAVAT